MIDITLANIDALRRAFDPEIVKKALDRAIKTAAERVRTQISRDVRERYNIKQGDIGKSVTLRAVKSDGVVQRLLVYTGGMLPLVAFAVGKPQARYGKRSGRPMPVRVRVLKSEGTKIVQGGFFAPAINSGKILIFRRTGVIREMKKGRYEGKTREAIEATYTQGIPTMVANKAILAKANDTASEVMHKEFTRQMGLLMDKTGAL